VFTALMAPIYGWQKNVVATSILAAPAGWVAGRR